VEFAGKALVQIVLHAINADSGFMEGTVVYLINYRLVIVIVIIQCLCCHLQKDRWPITMSTFALVTENVIMS